jgi:hypothetical protein
MVVYSLPCGSADAVSCGCFARELSRACNTPPLAVQSACSQYVCRSLLFHYLYMCADSHPMGHMGVGDVHLSAIAQPAVPLYKVPS